MLGALRRACRVKPRDAARRRHRRDSRYAHLDRLLDNVVHALGDGQALQQRDLQGRFALDRVVYAPEPITEYYNSKLASKVKEVASWMRSAR